MNVSGEIRPPGDKSISHRALLLAALGDGRSRVRGILDSADVRSTAGVLRALGASVPELAPEIVVTGLGLRGLRAPETALDCGNSGTTARLLAGVVAASPFAARFEGDESLSRRPMRRVARPLEAMGARFEFERADGLPMTVRGAPLRPINWTSETPSAQVKSAILLAAVVAGVEASVAEPRKSRDHTERMLAARGVPVNVSDDRVHVRGVERLAACDTDIPADPSSAAFFAALAALASGGRLTLRGVCVNPTRTGFLEALREMGATVELLDVHDEGGEPVGDVVVGPGALHGVEVGGGRVASLIDELPLLACVATRADGETRITGAGELRVKESDRIAAVVANLRAVGATAEELPDGIVVRGSNRPLMGAVATHGDHRLAMAFGVLGAVPGNRISVDDPSCVAVSFPTFWQELERLRGAARVEPPAGQARASGNPPGSRRRSGDRGRRVVIAIDGPAASGKSSTAQWVAERLGFRHVDSGSLYRAATAARLRAGAPAGGWTETDVLEAARAVTLQPSATSFAPLIDGRAADTEIRGPEVTRHVSQVARMPAVRAWVNEQVRRAAELYDVVVDGRDMGTVVFPDADLKVFLVADPWERARRRLIQLLQRRPTDEEIAEETDRIVQRDARDATQTVQATDAVLIDTTYLTQAEQVERIVALAKAVTQRETTTSSLDDSRRRE